MNLLRSGTSLVVLLSAFGGALALSVSCSPPIECASERIGQVRCVGNQVERCGQDNQLTYEPCSPKGLECSVQHQGCVTSEIAMSTSSTASVGGGGAGGDATTMTASSSTMSSSSSAGGMGGTGGEGGAPVVTSLNGCDLATAQNDKNKPIVQITFTSGVTQYLPPCIVVSPGTNVVWTSADGTFAQHPLRGGTVDDGGNKTPDPLSPISPQDAGSLLLLPMPTPGTYGFYCDFHPTAMRGAVFVEP